MLNIMYEIPSMDSVKECVINEEVILSGEEPILLLEQPQEAASSQ
jgi:ATP-dependent Clp protease ATP-binding subunit ClpX